MADIYFREAATQLFEAWSDAARAAAAAGRSGRGKGTATRAAAARAAFKQAGGKRSPYVQARKAVQKAKKDVYRDDSDSEDYMGAKAHRSVSRAISKLSKARKTAKHLTAQGAKELKYVKGQRRGDDLKPGDHWALGNALRGFRGRGKNRPKARF
jgi:predicted ATPase